MKKINKINICFLLSLLIHISIFSISIPNIKPKHKKNNTEIIFEIKKIEQLPKTYKITKEKKIEPKQKKNLIKTKNFKETIEEKKEQIQKEEKFEKELKESLLRYQDSIKQKIQENKQYPRWALRTKHEGIIRIAFNVLATGQIEKIQLIKSSNFSELNTEAILAVKRSNPFAPFPETLKEKKIQIEVDIIFVINKKE